MQSNTSTKGVGMAPRSTKGLKLTPESLTTPAPNFGGRQYEEPAAAAFAGPQNTAPNGEPLLDWADVPDTLEGEGLIQWEQLANYFRNNPDGPRESERVAVASLCEAVEMRALAAEALRDEGVMVPGRGNEDTGRLVKNPVWSIYRSADVNVRAWAAAIGVTPTARRRAQTKAAAVAKATPADNPFTRSAQ